MSMTNRPDHEQNPVPKTSEDTPEQNVPASQEQSAAQTAAPETSAPAEEAKPSVPEKKQVGAKSRNALLRYMTILFAVAFLAVTLSLVIETKKSKTTISELNQTSASALENAEMLQESNRELSDTNANLRDKIADLENNLKEANDAANEAEAALESAKDAQQNAENEAKACNLLFTALNAQQKGDTAAYENAMVQLEPLHEFLTGTAAEIYESLVKE